MSVSTAGVGMWAAITACVTTVVHVLVSNTHNTCLYDENEILQLLFQLYFETKTASSELLVFYSYLAE